MTIKYISYFFIIIGGIFFPLGIYYVYEEGFPYTTRLIINIINYGIGFKDFHAFAMFVFWTPFFLIIDIFSRLMFLIPLIVGIYLYRKIREPFSTDKYRIFGVISFITFIFSLLLFFIDYTFLSSLYMILAVIFCLYTLYNINYN